MTNTTKNPAIDWHNETQFIDVHPNADAPEALATIVRVELQAGRTVADGEKVKRAAWRVRAFHEGNTYPDANAPQCANAKGAISAVIKALFGGSKHHDIDAAAAQFKLPELAEEESEEPAVKWTEREDVDHLRHLQESADQAAQKYLSGEGDMRDGFYNLSRDVAEVAETLSAKEFGEWTKAGGETLRKVLSGKNAKAEFLKIGRLPRDYFDAMPETSNSAKAYERNVNLDKVDVAEAVAIEAWGKKKNSPKPGEVLKALSSELAAMSEDKKAPRRAIFAQHCQTFLDKWLDGFQINPFEIDGESGLLVPAKEKAGERNGMYIAPIQFGTGKRAHELVQAVCKAVNAMTPEAKAEAETAETEKEVAAAVKPRTFAQYGVTEAAMHLARILSAHEDYNAILDTMGDMADRADKAGENGWSEVLADVANQVSAEKAEAEEAEAETDADDAA
jgi:hypothetical protein